MRLFGRFTRASGPLSSALRFGRVWSGIILLAGTVVILSTYRDFGVSWDEPVQAQYGQGVFRYFASGFKDTSWNVLPHIKYYSPLFDLLGTVVSGSPNTPCYTARHLLTAFTGLLTILVVATFAGQLRSRVAVVTATLALALNPVFYGHSFFNPKDVPLAFGFTCFAYCMCQWLISGNFSMRWAAALGAALGFALGVRPAILPILVLFCMLLLSYIYWRNPSVRAQPKWQLSARIGKSLLLGGGIGWLIMIASWPWALKSPILYPFEAIRESVKFPFKYWLLFEGHYVGSWDLPRRYLIEYFLITTPLPISALALVGLARAIAGARREELPKACAFVIAALWVILPVGLFTIFRPNVYDGTRHFLFVLPGLAILAGAGAEVVVSLVTTQFLRRIATLAIVICLLTPLPRMWHLHPYEYVYFNELVGGLRGAANNYETDYWILSYKEAAQWINKRDKSASGEKSKVLLAGVQVCAPCFNAFINEGTTVDLIMKHDQFGPLRAPYDYYVAMTHYRMDLNYPGEPVVHTIGRDGVDFCVIKGRNRGL